MFWCRDCRAMHMFDDATLAPVFCSIGSTNIMQNLTLLVLRINSPSLHHFARQISVRQTITTGLIIIPRQGMSDDSSQDCSIIWNENRFNLMKISYDFDIKFHQSRSQINLPIHLASPPFFTEPPWCRYPSSRCTIISHPNTKHTNFPFPSCHNIIALKHPNLLSFPWKNTIALKSIIH